ncbi:hypothetical protein WNZ15_25880 [Roseibium sp. AS2]|uniref:hypothetical protein n=1 Tax=Roseibium sp. AS2 TaxID=3135781 RepID=UPI00317FCD38
MNKTIVTDEELDHFIDALTRLIELERTIRRSRVHLEQTTDALFQHQHLPGVQNNID